MGSLPGTAVSIHVASVGVLVIHWRLFPSTGCASRSDGHHKNPSRPHAVSVDDVVQILYGCSPPVNLRIRAISTIHSQRLPIFDVLRQSSLVFFIASGLTLVVWRPGFGSSLANVALFGLCRRYRDSPKWPAGIGVLAAIATVPRSSCANGLTGHGLAHSSFIRDLRLLWLLMVCSLVMWPAKSSTASRRFRQIGSGYLLGFLRLYYLLVLFLAIGTSSRRTVWGQIYAIGANGCGASLRHSNVAAAPAGHAVSGTGGLSSVISCAVEFRECRHRRKSDACLRSPRC